MFEYESYCILSSLRQCKSVLIDDIKFKNFLGKNFCISLFCIFLNILICLFDYIRKNGQEIPTQEVDVGIGYRKFLINEKPRKGSIRNLFITCSRDLKKIYFFIGS